MVGQNQHSNSEGNLLSDYPYQANFAEIDNLRIHFIDEGKVSAPAVLFLHGVPTWSYTFRKLFPVCLEAGYRIIAPDLPGFGNSEKPENSSVYSITGLLACVDALIQQLKLKPVVLFAHDWGAIIGMLLAASNPDRFAGIIVCNGYLPDVNAKSPALFRLWKLFCKYSFILPPGRIVDWASDRKLSKEERRAYDYPFLSKKEKAAIRILPQLIPVKKKHAEADLINDSWEKLKQWKKPFLTIFSTKDKITLGGRELILRRIPGTINQDHKILEGKHFIQEDAPELLGSIIIDFVKKIR